MPTLEDYAAMNGQSAQPEPEQTPQARSYAQARQDMEKAAELQASIAAQLEQGNAPQMILYTALRCIGLYAHDPGWAEAQEAQLDRIYGDLMQDSLLTDNSATALERHKKMAAEYNARTERQLKKNLREYKKITDNLSAALQSLYGAEAAELDE